MVFSSNKLVRNPIVPDSVGPFFFEDKIPEINWASQSQPHTEPRHHRMTSWKSYVKYNRFAYSRIVGSQPGMPPQLVTVNVPLTLIQCSLLQSSSLISNSNLTLTSTLPHTRFHFDFILPLMITLMRILILPLLGPIDNSTICSDVACCNLKNYV